VQGLTDFDTSVRLALRRVRAADVRRRWPGALDSVHRAVLRPGGRILGAAPTETLPATLSTETLPSDALASDPSWSGATVYTDVRTRVVHAPPERLWRVVEAIGGETGWYSFPLAWAVRGWLDRLAGGVGLRRGRRDPHRLHVGEALDFWRVEEVVPGSILRLRAEMRLPGRAWLEIRVVENGSGRSRYEQRAIFVPHGLAGRAYWAAIAPFHTAVFGGMARNIARAAEGAAPRTPITEDP
jgi:hypothetical protein